MPNDENLDNITEPESGVEATEPTPKARGIRELLDTLDKDETEDSSESVDGTRDESDGTDDSDEDETGKEEEEVEEIEETDDEEVEEEETVELAATHSQLKKKYPNIFKDFPGLRAKLGREYAYSDLFPTVNDARTANQKAEVFDQYEGVFNAGDARTLVKALPNLDSATKFAEDILPALRSAHPDLLTKAVDPFVRMMLNKVDSDAKSRGDKNLGLAAQYMAQYLYGKAEIPSLPKARSNEIDPEKEQLKAQLSYAHQTQVSNFEAAVGSSVNRTLAKEAKSLFDPKDTLSSKAQSVWIKQIITELDEELKVNPSHMAKMRAHREKALRSGLSDEFKSRILSAYLQTARPLLKTISQRIKSEAFGKKNGNGVQESKPVNRTEGRKVIPSSSATNKQPIVSSRGVTVKDVKKFKAQGGQMEDILGG